MSCGSRLVETKIHLDILTSGVFIRVFWGGFFFALRKQCDTKESPFLNRTEYFYFVAIGKDL